MENKNLFLSRLVLFTTFIAFAVVILGAYTRLTHSGLGCPDWPGCYKQLTVPDTSPEIAQAIKAYPSWPVHIIKAWTDMIHRYAAAALVLLIILIFATSLFKRIKGKKYPIFIPLFLLSLVILQAFIGMRIVTLRLAPLVVTGHLLCGLILLALLFWLYLKLKTPSF